MSKQKLRHWIYVAIFIALAGSFVWFLLMRDANITPEKIQEELTAQQDSFDAVADYLIEKEASAIIDGAVTAGRTYGVPEEDSNAYRAYSEGVRKVIEKDCVQIRSTGSAVLFVMKAQGGFLNQEHYIIAKNADNSSLPGEYPMELNSSGWKYYVLQGKP
ncbi:MAG: hypothetical protein J6Z45_06740 [Oscillospiraceae bacterium]|nr:hypothetical protein [Oscillospiraceae bacterium]